MSKEYCPKDYTFKQDYHHQMNLTDNLVFKCAVKDGNGNNCPEYGVNKLGEDYLCDKCYKRYNVSSNETETFLVRGRVQKMFDTYKN